jgi:hypothetical protein
MSVTLGVENRQLALTVRRPSSERLNTPRWFKNWDVGSTGPKVGVVERGPWGYSSPSRFLPHQPSRKSSNGERTFIPTTGLVSRCLPRPTHRMTVATPISTFMPFPWGMGVSSVFALSTG